MGTSTDRANHIKRVQHDDLFCWIAMTDAEREWYVWARTVPLVAGPVTREQERAAGWSR